MQHIRRTWARDGSVTVIFNIGISEDNYTEDNIKTEHQQHEDVLHYDIVDSYQNLTCTIDNCFTYIILMCASSVKSSFMLYWTQQIKYEQLSYIIKGLFDDSSF